MIELRLASKALCSAGTNTTKVSLIERLATPRAKHSATSIQGTNRLIGSPLARHRTAGKRFRGPAGLRQPHAGGKFRAAEELVDDRLIIERGFNGPRLSGNGGYVGGVMAERFRRQFGKDGAVEITLRAPIPLETPLQVTRD